MKSNNFKFIFAFILSCVFVCLSSTEAQLKRTGTRAVNVTGGVWKWEDVPKYEEFNDYPSNQNNWTESNKAAQRRQLKKKISDIQSRNNNIKAFPSAEDFPGIPPDGTPIIEKKATIDPRYSKWHSTGAYALPGVPVSIRIGKGKTDGLSVRVGCHTDVLQLEKHPSWTRTPELSYTKDFSGNKVEITSPSGGLVYINVSKAVDNGRPFEVTISNVVEAPLYIMGETTLEEWQAQLERCKAPWGEIVCPRLISTIRLEDLKSIEDIERIAKVLQDSLAAQDWLAGWDISSPGRLKEPMRFVTDRQLSAGAGHSGYPTMGGLSWGAKFANGDIYNGHWGLWHETGHNHQNAPWRMNEMGEVTVNLYTLVSYCMALDNTIDDWDAFRSKQSNIAGILNQKKKFHDLNGDFFTQLYFFAELIHGIGFEPLREVSIKYSKSPYPDSTSNDGKWEWLMVNLSEASGQNLSSYFDIWGFKISNSAKSRVEKYPTWLPYPDYPNNVQVSGTGSSGDSSVELDEYGNPVES